MRLQGFCSWRPILSDNEDDPFSSEGEGERGDAWTAEEIRFYPAAVAETFFPYLGITSKLE